MRMFFFPRLRFVIKDMEKTVSDLEKVDVARDDISIKVEGESPASVIREILTREVNRNFHRDRHRVVEQHETLQRFVPLSIVGTCLQRERRKTRRVILFSRDRWMEIGRELRRSMRRFAEEVVRVVRADAVEIVP